MLRIVKNNKLNLLDLKGYDEIRNGIDFKDYDDIQIVMDACNHDENILKEWFDKIGIKYDKLIMLSKSIIYEVGDESLGLWDLSSGERMLLYLMGCKKLNKKLVVHSLFERLGSRLRSTLDDVIYDYDNLVVVLYNSGTTEKLLKYYI